MQRTNPDIDIIMYVLEAVIEDQPHSAFAKSLHRQYCERGGLSKKQLEGLHSKASKIENIHPGRMATLQAIILKKHTRHKSEITVIVPQPAKDENTQKMIEAILAKYPEHKRILFFKARNDKNELLSPADIEEINRFAKLLLKD